MRKRCFISGPITLGNLGLNIQQATEAFLALARAGLAPMAPQLHCYLGSTFGVAWPSTDPGGLGHAVWLAIDLPWVAVSDCVLRLPGDSKGADMETAEAERLGIPVFHSIEEVVAWAGL